MINLAVLGWPVGKIAPCPLCCRLAGPHAIQAQAIEIFFDLPVNFGYDGKVAFARLAFDGIVLDTSQPGYLELLESAQIFRHTDVLLDLLCSGNADSTEFLEVFARRLTVVVTGCSSQPIKRIVKELVLQDISETTSSRNQLACLKR